MDVQMSMFDVITEDIDPLKEVAKCAGVYWTTSRKRLIEIQSGNVSAEEWTKAVKEEYCPYEYAGALGRENGPNTLDGWEMKTGKIKTWHVDNNGDYVENIYKWREFAEAVACLIANGEYT